jgi:predicted DsbA family dithiol-disulfide isomerase
MGGATMNFTVDVISDVICPWCFIGKRRLEKAVAAFGGPVKVSWLPFQLNPQMPKKGISRREYHPLPSLQSQHVLWVKRMVEQCQA